MLTYYHKNHFHGFGLKICDGWQPYLRAPYYETYHNKHMWESLWQLAWVSGHFAWNIDEDYERVWDDVNSKYYGPAWPYLRGCRLLLEEGIADSGVHLCYESAASSTRGLCYERPGVAAKANELLAKAEAAAGDDKTILRRVLRDKEFFRWNWAESGYSSIKNAENAISVVRAEGHLTVDGAAVEKRRFRGFGNAAGSKEGRQRVWEFLSEAAPLHWNYLAAKPGIAEARTDSPASGRCYLRVQSGASNYPIVTQLLRCNDDGVKKFSVSLKIRGDGDLQVSIYSNRFNRSLAVAPYDVDSREWQTFSHMFEFDAPGPKSLFIRTHSGTVDIDDVNVTAIGEEAMPDASVLVEEFVSGCLDLAEPPIGRCALGTRPNSRRGQRRGPDRSSRS